MSDPFGSVALLLLSPANSELHDFLREAHRLTETHPEILDCIERDLDEHGKRKKALRLQDAAWIESQTQTLPTITLDPIELVPETLRLGVGRPRTPAYVVFMFLMGRGFYGGVKSSNAMVLLQESTSLAVLVHHQGISMPGLSTLNAADSKQRVPMFDQVVARTGIVPNHVSTDDGYASRPARDELKSRGVKVVSINGSKGKKMTPAEDWDSVDYAAARNGRSAVESLMFVLKHGFDFGRVARRGLSNVQAELLEKALAYNLCRMAERRREAAELAA